MTNKKLMKKFIDVLIHFGPDLNEAKVVARYLAKLDKETIISTFEYGDYFKFMKFRSMFLEGVTKKDLKRIKEAMDLFHKYLLPVIKKKGLYQPSHIDNFTEKRKQLGLVRV